MPQASKYPWSTMRVGETRLVGDTHSASSAHVSLHRFREQCRRLGYPDDALPRFTLHHDREHAILEITRLEDGPLREANTRAQATTEARREAMEAYAALSAEVDAWIAMNVRRRRDGLGTLMFPLDRFQVLREVAPALADEVAGIDSLAADPGQTPHRLRRSTDDVAHSSAGDKPSDANLCARLTSACKSSQSR